MCLDLLLTVFFIFLFFLFLYTLFRLVTVNEYGMLSMLGLDRSCCLISFSGGTVCVCVCVGGGGGGGGGRQYPLIHVHFFIDFDYCVYHFRLFLIQLPISGFTFSDVTPKSLSCSFSTCLLTGSLLPKESTTNFLSAVSLLQTELSWSS